MLFSKSLFVSLGFVLMTLLACAKTNGSATDLSPGGGNASNLGPSANRFPLPSKWSANSLKYSDENGSFECKGRFPISISPTSLSIVSLMNCFSARDRFGLGTNISADIRDSKLIYDGKLPGKPAGLIFGSIEFSDDGFRVHYMQQNETSVYDGEILANLKGEQLVFTKRGRETTKSGKVFVTTMETVLTLE